MAEPAGQLYLLRQSLLQGCQGSVRVAGVRLQRLHPVLQVAQLFVFIPKLLLQVLNLHGGMQSEKNGQSETCT